MNDKGCENRSARNIGAGADSRHYWHGMLKPDDKNYFKADQEMMIGLEVSEAI